jgi:EpsI family protein
MHRLRLYLPALILLSGSVLLWRSGIQRAMPLADALTIVLPEMPLHEVVEQRLTDDERRLAGMSDYVARAYLRDGAVAFTTFVSYYDRQTQGRTIHSPRNCLPGAGWEIVTADKKVMAVGGDLRRINRYELRNGGASTLVYYWYQGRGRVNANEYVVKWSLLKDAALRGRSEEALVRVVLPLPSGSSDARADRLRADSIAAAVVPRIMTDLERALPQRANRREVALQRSAG